MLPMARSTVAEMPGSARRAGGGTKGGGGKGGGRSDGRGGGRGGGKGGGGPGSNDGSGSAGRGVERVLYRKDFGTPGGWREIRGLQVRVFSSPSPRYLPPPLLLLSRVAPYPISPRDPIRLPQIVRLSDPFRALRNDSTARARIRAGMRMNARPGHDGSAAAGRPPSGATSAPRSARRIGEGRNHASHRVAANATHAKIKLRRTTVNQTELAWYMDRLGKLERYRRQIYALSLTPYGEGLWLGLLTTIEWAKDGAEADEPEAPAFERDTTQVYLVTSRDGVSIDTSWVYAHRPLLPRDGLRQKDWGSGFVLPAAQILTDPPYKLSPVGPHQQPLHRLYYEARRTRHEQRFDRPGVIGLATWSADRIVGIRCATQRPAARSPTPINGSGEARRASLALASSCELTTKLIKADGGTLAVDADTSPRGATLVVEILGRCLSSRLAACFAHLRSPSLASAE